MGDGEFDGHAFLVGPPGENLKGVEHDVRCMAEMLQGRGFAVEVCTGERATRAGILTGYDSLINKVRRDQAAVFYYTGHGFHAFRKAEARSWQGICPVDLAASTTTDFRGITAWELSIKQAQLTEQTPNVTVILDCCYASQMSRGPAAFDAIPRALPHPVRLGFAAHLDALRATYGAAFDAVEPAGNCNAVRLVACGQDEAAYECESADGQHSGAFTTALLEVLREVNDVPVSWAAIENAIRGRVLRRFPVQRPEIEGPAYRQLFSLGEDRAGAAVTITEMSDGFRLGAGRLMGVAPGDVYGVMPPGPPMYRATDAIAEVCIHEAFATFAHAKLHHWQNGHSALPRNAIAVLAEKTSVRCAVRIEAPEPARSELTLAIEESMTLRRAEPKEEAPLATLRLTDGALTIEDRLGPLFPATRFRQDVTGTIKNLANLAAAQAVRELEGENGVLAKDLEIEWGVVERGEMRRMPERGGALGLQDRVYVKVNSNTQRTLHAHIFNIGLRGTITLLTADLAPSGVALTREEPEFVLGRRDDGTLLGVELRWPDGMPRDTFPRIDELLVIVTSTPASLRGLETVEYIVAERGPHSKLQALLVQLQDGGSRSTRATGSIDDFLTKRLWYFLHPRDAVMADLSFEIDDNPLGQVAARARDAWVTPPKDSAATTKAPTAIAIRFADLVIENCRALPSNIRLDALICTRSMSKARGYSTWTQRYRGITDGRLSDLENRVVFEGPVQDFFDLYLWISRDTDDSLEQLLAQCATTPVFKDAVGALLIETADGGPPWIAAVGASAILSRIAYDALRAKCEPLGLYRTSFLASEHFGVGYLPREGLHHSEEISFRLLIEAA